MRLANKVALITGAGGPMGRAIAQKFASEGAHLVLTNISGTRLNQSVETIAAAHPQCQVIQQRANGIDAKEAAEVAGASWTRSLAGEFAPHINVNCIAPGVIRTSVTERIEDVDVRRLTAASFLKRFGEAREIADVACFLASDEASFVTSEIIAVSGGNHPSL